LGDGSVAIGVELGECGGRLAELDLANRAVAVGVEGGEYRIGATHAEAAATAAKAAPFFGALAVTAKAAAFVSLAAFTALAAGRGFLAELFAGVASAGGLGKRRRRGQQAEG
jgi:hypothetical protein